MGAFTMAGRSDTEKQVEERQGSPPQRSALEESSLASVQRSKATVPPTAIRRNLDRPLPSLPTESIEASDTIELATSRLPPLQTKTDTSNKGRTKSSHLKPEALSPLLEEEDAVSDSTLSTSAASVKAPEEGRRSRDDASAVVFSTGDNERSATASTVSRLSSTSSASTWRQGGEGATGKGERGQRRRANTTKSFTELRKKLLMQVQVREAQREEKARARQKQKQRIHRAKMAELGDSTANHGPTSQDVEDSPALATSQRRPTLAAVGGRLSTYVLPSRIERPRLPSKVFGASLRGPTVEDESRSDIEEVENEETLASPSAAASVIAAQERKRRPSASSLPSLTGEPPTFGQTIGARLQGLASRTQKALGKRSFERVRESEEESRADRLPDQAAHEDVGGDGTSSHSYGSLFARFTRPSTPSGTGRTGQFGQGHRNMAREEDEVDREVEIGRLPHTFLFSAAARRGESTTVPSRIKEVVSSEARSRSTEPQATRGLLVPGEAEGNDREPLSDILPIKVRKRKEATLSRPRTVDGSPASGVFCKSVKGRPHTADSPGIHASNLNSPPFIERFTHPLACRRGSSNSTPPGDRAANADDLATVEVEFEESLDPQSANSRTDLSPGAPRAKNRRASCSDDSAWLLKQGPRRHSFSQTSLSILPTDAGATSARSTSPFSPSWQAKARDQGEAGDAPSANRTSRRTSTATNSINRLGLSVSILPSRANLSTDAINFINVGEDHNYAGVPSTSTPHRLLRLQSQPPSPMSSFHLSGSATTDSATTLTKYERVLGLSPGPPPPAPLGKDITVAERSKEGNQQMRVSVDSSARKPTEGQRRDAAHDV